jgi:hypothetical protein
MQPRAPETAGGPRLSGDGRDSRSIRPAMCPSSFLSSGPNPRRKCPVCSSAVENELSAGPKVRNRKAASRWQKIATPALVSALPRP